MYFKWLFITDHGGWASVLMSLFHKITDLGRYMIANINTITTSTTVPTGLLQRKENKIKKRLSRWCCAAEKANYARRCHERDVLARIVSAWVDLTAHGRLENASQWPRPAQSTHGVFEILRSTTAPDELCTEGREEEATSLPAAGLFFANCYEIVLPNPMTSLQLQEREAKALSARVESSLTQWARAGMKRFRDRARLRHQYRGRLRRAEFDAWSVYLHTDCTRSRCSFMPNSLLYV